MEPFRKRDDFIHTYEGPFNLDLYRHKNDAPIAPVLTPVVLADHSSP